MLGLSRNPASDSPSCASKEMGSSFTPMMCGAAIRMRIRIASPEMFLNAEPLPHVICSRTAEERGGDDEAIEHGNA